MTSDRCIIILILQNISKMLHYKDFLKLFTLQHYSECKYRIIEALQSQQRLIFELRHASCD